MNEKIEDIVILSSDGFIKIVTDQAQYTLAVKDGQLVLNKIVKE